jgi:hypothetical protein
LDNKVNFDITLENLIKIGANPKRLSNLYKEELKKANVDCYFYHRAKKSDDFNCPCPDQCEPKREIF